MVWGPRRFFIYFFVTGLGAAALHSFVTYLEISSMQRAATAFYNTLSPELLAAFMKSYLGQQVPQITDLINNWYNSPTNPSLIQQGTEIVQQIAQMKIN